MIWSHVLESSRTWFYLQDKAKGNESGMPVCFQGTYYISNVSNILLIMFYIMKKKLIRDKEFNSDFFIFSDVLDDNIKYLQFFLFISSLNKDVYERVSAGDDDDAAGNWASISIT